MAAFLDSFYSVSVQCLKTPSEALNPQSQADMVTRVFWIAVSLLESDYEHEFLMAIHLLNKVGLRKITKSATDCRTSVSPGVENRLRFKNNKGWVTLSLSRTPDTLPVRAYQVQICSEIRRSSICV